MRDILHASSMMVCYGEEIQACEPVAGSAQGTTGTHGLDAGASGRSCRVEVSHLLVPLGNGRTDSTRPGIGCDEVHLERTCPGTSQKSFLIPTKSLDVARCNNA